MKVIPTRIPDVLIIEPNVYGDERGFFFESYNRRKLKEHAGVDAKFVQDNHSRSEKGVLRGLHYQIRCIQGKFVRVVSGEVFDIAVDLRASSASFGQWVGVHISAENHRMVWIPEGFAHGFIVMSDYADFLYKATNYYAPEHERCILWDDRDLAIEWPIDIAPIVSAKDAQGAAFRDAEVFA